ncbi:ATP-binding protein [Sulfolobus tengchongensis]|uniref:ATP-binding protein n=1 Tax=Sulfolobus tengchongensis TaxID=207809 RepID=A0AAX4L1Q0_9CREN
MNVEELKRIVSDQQETANEKLNDKRIIDRDVPDLLHYLIIPNALAILGVRRSGKSTLAIRLMRGKKFTYVNFDDEALRGITANDLRHLEEAIYQLYGEVDYLVFDEIHNVEGWELFISRLRDTKRVIITGSNSKMLSGELATYLTGRHSDYILFPFSFKEYLGFKGIKVEEESFYSTRKVAELKRELENYLITGGFPEALILGRSQLNVIYNDILFKDIISRLKIREIEKFREFCRSIISLYSNEVSLNSLAKTLRVDNKTIENWFFGLQNAYLIFPISRYGEKVKQRLTYNKKVYIIDPGLISSIAVKSRDKGRLMENVVALHLLRQKQMGEIYFIRNDYEVDFYDEENSRLIQVTYAMDKIEEREIKGLIREKNRAKELIIVSWDLEYTEKVENREIKVIPLYKFLLK